MRQAFFALTLGGALAGCAAASAVNITQNDVDAARSAYDAAFLAPAATYRGLPVCAAGQAATLASPCASAATIRKLQAADAQIELAFEALQNLLASGGPQNLVGDYQALTQSIAAAESLLSAFGAN